MFTNNDDFRRRISQLEARVVALERELVGLRSERRARLSAKRVRYKAVVTESGGIAVGGEGQVTIYKNATPTTWMPKAKLNWMANQDLAHGTKVIIEFFEDENSFVVTNAECP